MKQLMTTLALIAFIGSSSVASALPTLCFWFDEGGTCGGSVFYDMYSDQSMWSYGCNDGFFAYGTLAGNETEQLCDSIP